MTVYDVYCRGRKAGIIQGPPDTVLNPKIAGCRHASPAALPAAVYCSSQNFGIYPCAPVSCTFKGFQHKRPGPASRNKAAGRS